MFQDLSHRLLQNSLPKPAFQALPLSSVVSVVKKYFQLSSPRGQGGSLYFSHECGVQFVLNSSGSDDRNHLPLRKGRNPKRQRMIPIAAPTGLKHQLRATLWGLKCNNNDRHNCQESASNRASMCRAIFPIYYRISSSFVLSVRLLLFQSLKLWKRFDQTNTPTSQRMKPSGQTISATRRKMMAKRQTNSPMC